MTDSNNQKDTWWEVSKKIAVGFTAITLATLIVKAITPGYPIYVGSSSIEPGAYWLDLTTRNAARGSTVTFDFNPTEHWLARIYKGPRVFTKHVAAIEGDEIKADAQGNLQACFEDKMAGQAYSCKSIGVPIAQDSAGRPLKAFLNPGESYTLIPGEIWVYGEHPRSLDSRYYGPITMHLVKGKATKLFGS